MSRWFRHYAGMMRDDKLVRAALRAKQPIERVLWVWGAILESAAEINDDGRYDIDAAEVAYFLRSDEADISAVMDALAAAGRVAEGRVVHWGARQFQSDRSATRQAAYRERKRSPDGHGDAVEGEGDGAVTVTSRHGDAPETETETETEPKKKKDRFGARAPANDDFEEFKKAYPSRGDGGNPWPPAQRLFEEAVKAGQDPKRIIAAARAGVGLDKDAAGTKYIPQAVKWLRNKCYLDYLDGTEADLKRRAEADLMMEARGYIWEGEPDSGKWVQKPPDVPRETGIGPIAIPALRTA